MKLAFIGIGKVGFALANNLAGKGYDIIVAHNNVESESVRVAITRNPSFSAMPIQEAIDEADIIFLAVPFHAAQEIITQVSFHNKPLVDCTNPVGPSLRHGLNSEISGAEKIQEWSGDARVVKAYTIYGFENLVDPTFSRYNVNPVMLIAGDDLSAKDQVALMNTDLGFKTLDTGPLTQSLHLEHMTLLWVDMVRKQGHHPHFTWAMLEK